MKFKFRLVALLLCTGITAVVLANPTVRGKSVFLDTDIKDGAGVARFTAASATSNLFVGQAADAAGASANIHGSVALTGGTDRDLDRWCNGAATCTTSTAAARVTSDGTIVSTTNQLKVPVVHGSATLAQAIEAGSGAMTAGSLAVTFGTAFGAAPLCVCSHVNAVPIACGPTTAGSGTTVTFAVPAGGSGTVNWYCIGQR